jgi:D-alanyl-D-alanine dipeptidase
MKNTISINRLQLIFLLGGLLFYCNIYAQPTDIINTKKLYKTSVEKSEKNKLIDLSNIKNHTNLFFDLRYATVNNFTKNNLYTKATTTYLRYDAALAFKKVVEALMQKKLFIKIFDAYRPYSATKLMWDLIHDERYVANPKSGSNHNRGLSIDLTLTNTDGVELNMGTGFDNFTDTAHQTFTNLPTEILANRKLLKETMEANGFKALETEWWHYTFVTTEKYAVIDLPFKLLKKLIK